MQILVCFFGLAELSVQILFSCGRCECLKRHGESELGADFRVYCVAKTSRGLESFPAGGGKADQQSQPHQNISQYSLLILLPERLRTTSIRLLVAISESKPCLAATKS